MEVIFEAPSLIFQIGGWVLLLGIRTTVACLILPPLDFKNIGATGPLLALMVGGWVAWGNVAEPMAVGLMPWIGLFFKEALIGIALGVCGATFFWVVEYIGVILDAKTGFNNIQQTDPMRNEENTPLANSFGQCANAFFFMTAGASSFLGMLFASYHWWPVFDPFPNWMRLMEFVIHQMAHATLVDAISYVAGLLGILLLIDWLLSLTSRISPKMELTELNQPIKAVLTLIILALLVLQYWPDFAELSSLPMLCEKWAMFDLIDGKEFCKN